MTVSANKAINRHALKFGGEFRVLLDNIPNYSFATFNFTNGWTQRDANNADAASGNPFASFLMGLPQSGNSNFNPTPAWGNRYYGLYVQDDWRIARNVTLNIGGRWDYDSPYTDRFNRQNAGFDPTAPSPFQVPGLALKGGLLFTSPDNRLAHKRDLNNFQPRVGIAWHLFPKTVIRGGYGLSFIPTFVPGGTQGFAAQTPYVSSTDNNVTLSDRRLSSPFPEGMLRPTSSSLGLATFLGQDITYVHQDRVIPFIQQYSAGLQHEFPAQVLLDVSYVGSQTRKLGVNKNLNVLSAEQLALGTAYLNQTVPNPFAGLLPGLALNSATTPRRNLLRPYPQFEDITRQQLPVGKAWYNALQFQLTKRLSHGLHVQFIYTWSVTMEAASYLNPQFRDDQLQRVRSEDDLPHRATIMGGYELPFFKNSSGLKKSLFGGWQVNAITIFQSGRQLNTPDAYPTGVDPTIPGPYRPDGYYFNACTLSTAGIRQNCATPDQPVAWIQRPADTLRVTGTRWNQVQEMRPVLLDSSIFKTFYPKEGLQVQVRFESFNTFNTPWFGQAQTGITNARFGLLGNSQTNDPRNTQIALKVSF